VELEDPAGRVWPMTYRSVPARYSYEFRAGWKALAGHWGISTGDTVTLVRPGADRFRLRIEVRAAAAAWTYVFKVDKWPVQCLEHLFWEQEPLFISTARSRLWRNCGMPRCSDRNLDQCSFTNWRLQTAVDKLAFTNCR